MAVASKKFAGAALSLLICLAINVAWKLFVSTPSADLVAVRSEQTQAEIETVREDGEWQQRYVAPQSTAAGSMLEPTRAEVVGNAKLLQHRDVAPYSELVKLDKRSAWSPVAVARCAQG